MPNYTYRDERDGSIHDETMSIAEWEKMLEVHPYYKWVPSGALPTLDPMKCGRMKPDSGFRDLLKTIKKGSPRSTVNTWGGTSEV